MAEQCENVSSQGNELVTAQDKCGIANKSAATSGSAEAVRCLYSNLILIFLLGSIACFGISFRYPWLQTCCTSKGFVSLGLLEINETFVGFETQETSIFSLLVDNTSGIDLKALMVTLASTVISGMISIVSLFITSINIWFNSKGFFTGPGAVYLLNFGASLFSTVALAAFLDFYAWCDGVRIVPPKYYDILFALDPSSNKETPFVPSVELQLGFYIHLGGVCSSVLGFAFACRLASKLLAVQTSRKGQDPLRDKSRRIAVAKKRTALKTEGTELEMLQPAELQPTEGETQAIKDDDSVKDLDMFDQGQSRLVTTVI